MNAIRISVLTILLSLAFSGNASFDRLRVPACRTTWTPSLSHLTTTRPAISVTSTIPLRNTIQTSAGSCPHRVDRSCACSSKSQAFARTNTFGIYDINDIDNKLELFSGSDSGNSMGGNPAFELLVSMTPNSFSDPDLHGHRRLRRRIGYLLIERVRILPGFLGSCRRWRVLLTAVKELRRCRSHVDLRLATTPKSSTWAAARTGSRPVNTSWPGKTSTAISAAIATTPTWSYWSSRYIPCRKPARCCCSDSVSWASVSLHVAEPEYD